MVSHLEFLVEDLSMERAVRRLAPKIVEGITFEVHPHQCKTDLLNKPPSRLRGYSSWLPEESRIVVIVDRDNDSCLALKKELEETAVKAGLRTRTSSGGRTVQVVNRIAIEEMEAWFFGDWQAVRQAYPKVSETIPAKQQYRDPDAIAGGTWEALERILQRAGYFSTGLRKIEAAEKIASFMEPERNRSASFRALYTALTEMTE